MLRLAELAAKALLDQSPQPKYIARVDNTLWESIREGGGGTGKGDSDKDAWRAKQRGHMYETS